MIQEYGGSIIPHSTYRLQLRGVKGVHLTFAEVEKKVVPYLKHLNVSSLYLSPILRATKGSTHGYDVADFTELDPELGTEADLASLARACHHHKMSILIDIVPNHVGVSSPIQNPFWCDVLEFGLHSESAHLFDIDWKKPMRDGVEDRPRVFLPVLGDLYGDILKKGEVHLGTDLIDSTGKAPRHVAFRAAYYDKSFPLRASSYFLILREAADEMCVGSAEEKDKAKASNPVIQQAYDLALDFLKLDATSSKIVPHLEKVGQEEKKPEITAHQIRTQMLELQHRLSELYCIEANGLKQALEKVMHSVNADRKGQLNSPPLPPIIDPEQIHHPLTMDSLLSAQHYRLMHWKLASSELNYRRFFDINDLAALRIEDSKVLETTHATIIDWIRKGYIQGLRIDHIDGLLRPTTYLRDLQELIRHEVPTLHLGSPAPLNPPFYVVVEKILEGRESLSESWSCFGTTGYEFSANIAGCLWTDASGFQRITHIYNNFLTKSVDDSALSSSLPMKLMQSPTPSQAKPRGPPSSMLMPVAAATGTHHLMQKVPATVSTGPSRFETMPTPINVIARRFDELVRDCKLLMLQTSFQGDLDSLTHRLHKIARTDPFARDLGAPALKEAISEFCGWMKKYRTYVDCQFEQPGKEAMLSLEDHNHAHETIHLARQHISAKYGLTAGAPHSPSSAKIVHSDISPAEKARGKEVDLALNWLLSVISFSGGIHTTESKRQVGVTLGCFTPEERAERCMFIMKLQQLSSAVHAKGLEDTALYRYFPLSALNEVGSHPIQNALQSMLLHPHTAIGKSQRTPVEKMGLKEAQHHKEYDIRQLQFIQQQQLESAGAGDSAEILEEMKAGKAEQPLESDKIPSSASVDKMANGLKEKEEVKPLSEIISTMTELKFAHTGDIEIEALHHLHRDALRRERWRHQMLSSSTHDSKRSEDVRARICAISEIPDEWSHFLQCISEDVMSAGLKTRATSTSSSVQFLPDANDEYLIYQTLIGMWPVEIDLTQIMHSVSSSPTGTAQEHIERVRSTISSLEHRVQEAIIKSCREAKRKTSWTHVDQTYETAIRNFIHNLLFSTNTRNLLQSFARRIARTGYCNALTSLVIKATTLGVPDIYNGTEVWNFTLVDPDNRGVVDWDHLNTMLNRVDKSLQVIGAGPEAVAMHRVHVVRDLFSPDYLTTGALKLFCTQQLLRTRKHYARLFEHGTYIPLQVYRQDQGELVPDNRVFAFARHSEEENQTCIVMVARLLLSCGNLVVPGSRWNFHEVERIWSNSFVDIDFGGAGTFTKSASTFGLDAITHKLIRVQDFSASAGQGRFQNCIRVPDAFSTLPFCVAVFEGLQE